MDKACRVTASNNNMRDGVTQVSIVADRDVNHL